ncbi:MAG TPA: DUF4215 domain-containing protein, partial [Nannocystaceae bacterium]|nr:DUF4215 domain-containing protein [Nannocystaceae bacterium]
MGVTRATAFAVVTLAMSPGCPFDSSGGASGAASIGDDTGTDTGDAPGTSQATTDGEDVDGSGGSSETGAGECPPGENGCPCDGESCDEGFACANGTCVPADCGNGMVEANEECDDENDVPDDGCESNCSYSVGAA